LVGASDYLPNTIWVKNFLAAQGYELIYIYLKFSLTDSLQSYMIGLLAGLVHLIW
jgi:hypothetical protein